MATSGTYTFTLDVIDVIEEAYERCSIELKVGYDLVTARRSLNLLLTDWTLDDVNLWTLDQTELVLTSGTASYTLASPAFSVLDACIRVSGSSDTDYAIERISIEQYLELPDKTTQGRPVQFAVERGRSGPVVYLYPTPSAATYSLFYYRIRDIQDITVTYTDNPDVPKRFLPALCSGLAWYLSEKNKAKMVTGSDGRPQWVDGVSPQDRLELKARYTEDYTKAKEADADRASLFIRPWRGYGNR